MSDEFPFEVCENKRLGRYLVASRDIKVGEIILREQPLIRGPAQATGPVCLSCFQGLDERNSGPCRKCGWPLCKKVKCHESPEHEAECFWTTQKRGEKVKIGQFVTPHRTYECVFPIRCLYQKEANPVLWKKLTSLESHCEQRKGTERYEADRLFVAQFLYRFFKIKLQDFTEEEILKICGVIQVNGHEIPLSTPPYVAIYEKASMLEHNCSPNCCKSFTADGSILIRATRYIKCGKHISICYTDPTWSNINRREHLALTKFFYCECERCGDPTEFDTYYSALKCSKDCDGYVVPHLTKGEDLLPKPAWKCEKCRVEKPATEIKEILTNVARDFSMTDKRDVESCKKFLQHYAKNDLLHLNHYFLADVRLGLAQLYGQSEQIEGDLQNLTKEDLQHKLDLCVSCLGLAEILYPSEWRLRGVLMFELHAALAEKARREYSEDEIDAKGLTEKLLESKKSLETAKFYLKYEPDVLPEGKMAAQADHNLRDLDILLEKIAQNQNGNSEN